MKVNYHPNINQSKPTIHFAGPQQYGPYQKHQCLPQHHLKSFHKNTLHFSPHYNIKFQNLKSLSYHYAKFEIDFLTI